MANTTVKGNFNVVAENGDVQTIYPKTTGDQVIVDRSSNTSVIPNDVANLQHIVNKMGSLAFKSKIETSDFTTGTMIGVAGTGNDPCANLKANTDAGKIADALIIKNIESRVDTLENSNLVTVDELDAGLATKPDTEINDAVTSTSLTWSSKKLSDRLTTLNSNTQLLNSRVNGLSTLQEGSTTGDAELIDIRTGTDGFVYETAGSSVRNQLRKTINKISELKERLDSGYSTVGDLNFIHGRIAGSGEYFNNPYTWRTSQPFKIESDALVSISLPENVSASLWSCENESCLSGTLRLTNSEFLNGGTQQIEMRSDLWYMLCVFYTNDFNGQNHTSPTPEELAQISFSYINNNEYYTSELNRVKNELSAEISDLKGLEQEIRIPELEYVHGRIAGKGTFFSDGARFRSKHPFSAKSGDRIIISLPDGVKCSLWEFSDEECTHYIAVAVKMQSSEITVSADGYWHLCVEDSENSSTVLSEDKLSGIKAVLLPEKSYFLGKFAEIEEKTDLNRQVIHVTDFPSQEDELLSKIDQIRDEDTLIFSLCTDVHGTNYPDNYTPDENLQLTGSKGYRNYQKLAKIIALLSEKSGADFIANLGDTIAATTDEAVDDFNHSENKRRFSEFSRIISSGNIPYLYTIGHHEMFKLNIDGVSKSEICGSALRYTRYLNPVYNQEDSDCAYYYVDFDQPGYPDVRYISLDCCTENHGAKYSDTEIAWIRNTALNTDKPVIVVSHMGTRAVNSLSTPVNGELVADCLNNFVSSGGKVLAFIHGHTHCDNIITPSESGDSYPDITSLCSWCYTPSVSDVLGGNPSVEQRLYDSYSEFAIDIYAVNCKTGSINIFRFGAGSDRIYQSE